MIPIEIIVRIVFRWQTNLHWMRSSIDGVLRSAGIGAAPVNVKLDQFVHSMKFSFSQPHVAFDNGQLNWIKDKNGIAIQLDLCAALHAYRSHRPLGL